MKFVLTPHINSILEGRGMKLICCAPKCLHQPQDSSDPLYGRRLEVTGYGLCPRCKHQTSIFLFENINGEVIPKCEICNKHPVKVVYTQVVESKHRKNHHYYYHEECYQAMFFGDEGFRKKVYKTRYAGTHGKGCVVYLPFDPRKGVCDACGKSKAKGEIKMTMLHHWKYAYKAVTVIKNPILVLENTSELCFACHMIADGFRNIMKLSLKRIMMVAKVMTPELQEYFLSISKEFIRTTKKGL